MIYAWWYQDEIEKSTIMVGYYSELQRPSWNRDWLLIIADDYQENRETFASMIVNAMNKEE